MNTKLNHVQNWLELAEKANWSVSRLARGCGVTPRTLERYFRRNMGTSPKSWMIEQRRLMACELLRNDYASVKEAAMQLGYKQAHHFSQEFRKYLGRLSQPIRYQRSKRQKGVALLYEMADSCIRFPLRLPLK